ncbi:MAG: cytidylate kinase family protein, partial [Candidatus Methylomirabilota bacterium]
MAIIAVSRGTFSGGEALARHLAERLGYQWISREVILQTAWGYGVPA